MDVPAADAGEVIPLWDQMQEAAARAFGLGGERAPIGHRASHTGAADAEDLLDDPAADLDDDVRLA